MSNQTIHLEAIFFRSVFDAMLHHVASDFLLREHGELVETKADDLGPRFLSSLSDDSLHNIVAPVVRDEFVGDFVELFKDERFIGLRSLLDHALNNSTGILLLREFRYPTPNSIVDKIDTLPRQLGQNLLDNVVAVIALHYANDFRLDFACKFDLLFDKNIFKSLSRMLLARRGSSWLTFSLTSCTQRQPYNWVESCTT